MTRRLFVCHATADIEATSELVDALENALSFSAGSVWTSSLPGYSAEPNDMPALGAALAGSDVVLALVTQTSVHDPQFHFQLGAAWALGAHTVLFLLDASAHEALPSTLSLASVMRGHEPSQWPELIGDLSVRLGLVPRPGASSAPALKPSSPPPALKSAPPPPATSADSAATPSAAAGIANAQDSTAASTQLAATPSAPAPSASNPPASAPSSAQPSASDTREAAPTTAAPAVAASRADDTPLPAAVARIANASARPLAAALSTSSANAPTSPAQPRAAAPVSVPPLPGARPSSPASVPPLSAAAAPRAVGVPPLPAAVPTSTTIVPPPPSAETTVDDSEALDASEPVPAPIIIMSAAPEPELEPDSEAQAATDSTSRPKPDTKPQPRAAGPHPSVAPTHSYLDELRAIGGPDPDERTPPRYSYVDDLDVLDATNLGAAASGYDALPPEEEEPETREQLRVAPREEAAGPGAHAPQAVEHPSDSDVFARLPTCEMALEAGRAVSDCVFNRDEIDNFAAELDGPLGGLIESLGASWVELRSEQDLDTWIAVTDHLLQTLPDEVRKLEEWYRVGFELATLHNLAGQLVLDGSDEAAEQHWRGALERFLMRAERAEIGYENLGRVLGLLENLVGPSHERDLSNIPRSLEELRRYAAGADIHTAA